MPGMDVGDTERDDVNSLQCRRAFGKAAKSHLEPASSGVSMGVSDGEVAPEITINSYTYERRSVSTLSVEFKRSAATSLCINAQPIEISPSAPKEL